jgi:hypothetical protein
MAKYTGPSEIQCPGFVAGLERNWYKCSCGRLALKQANGQEFYHNINCKKSNGIDYYDPERNTTLPHKQNCSCNVCEPPRDELPRRKK